MQKQKVNGVNLAYVDRGQGPVVLFVHGFPLNASMWDAQIESLSQNYRVIVPDLRGFGQSGPVEAEVVTMEQMADDLAGLLDALAIEEPITLAGLSMGGYIAMPFWRKYASRLRALILCDTRAEADTPLAVEARRQTARRILDEKTTDALIEGMFPKLLAPDTPRDQPQVAKALKKMILQADPRTAATVLLGMGQRSDSTELLGQIDCPALVLVGRHDALTPPAAMRAMADAMPQSRFVEIADAGHLAPMEQPDAVNRAMEEFLGRLPTR